LPCQTIEATSSWGTSDGSDGGSIGAI
jgi:hypothetical protein